MTAAWARDPSPPPRAGAGLARLLAPLALVAVATAVWHRALATYFAQDDFVCLARVRGLVPRLGQPWRWVSQELVWDLTRPFGVESALALHLLGLGVHLANALLLHHLLSRRLSRPAAFLGAAFFAVHPSAFHALYWASAIADSLQLAFALGALVLALRDDRVSWLALPVFALSLVSKEGLVLLPAVVVLHRLGSGAWGPGWPAPGASRRAIRGLDLSLAALAAAFLAYFVTIALPTRIGAPGVGSAAAAPYDVSLGANVFANLVTYLGWTANFALPTVRSFADAADPNLTPWGVVAAGAALAGCAWPALRARGWIEGTGTYVAFVAPLLVLRHHTYHYYLYAALSGAAMCAATLADLALGRPARARGAEAPRVRGAAKRVRHARRPAPGFAWAAAAALAIVLAINGHLLVRKIELHPLGVDGRRADPIVDRAIIARNALASLRDARLPAGASLLLWWTPPAGDPASDAPGYWARNVEAAVAGGAGIAVMAPSLAGAEFVARLRPLGAHERLGLYRSDGTIDVASPGRAEALVRRATVRRAGPTRGGPEG